MSTVPEALGVLRRSAAARPLLTYYDHGTGERTELSGATFDNWVAKTASYLTEELDLERGESLGVDLPSHWMSAIFAAAAWSLGVVVEAESHAQERAAARDAARVVVCGPDTLNDHQATGGRHVVACALHPLATRFATPLPAGVRDFGVEVWGQPDAFTPWDPPEPDDLATPALSQADLLAAGAARVPAGSRVLTDQHPLTLGLEVYAGVLAGAGSLVLVRGGTPGWRAGLVVTERVDLVALSDA